MNNLNFKFDNPIAQLIASEKLSITGGELQGNLVIKTPYKISQCADPTSPCDVANKAYVDSIIGGGPFLPLAGGTMTGAISQPIAPVAVNDLTNKAYVDSIVVPDATNLIKGKIQLSGDLNGTASAPTIAPLAVTNAKLANLSNTSQLKGSSSSSSTATDISLDSTLNITGTTLGVNTTSLSSSFLSLSGGTMTGAISQPNAPSAADDLTNKTYVDAQIATVNTPDATTSIKGKIQLAGDLNGTASAPTIAPLAVTNSKLANLSSVRRLKGSSSSSTAATDISLGSSMSMTGTTLNSGISFFAGSNPNITTPTDRPATSNVLYVGNNCSIWIWNETIYITRDQQYKRVTSDVNVNESGVASTAIPDLTITLAAGQRARVHYLMRCFTDSGTFTMNFGFPAWNSSIIWTAVGYSCQALASSTINTSFYATDLTDTTGVTTSFTQPDWSSSPALRLYTIDGEVFNNSSSSVNWTINVIASDSGSHSRLVKANSSVAYSYF